MAIPDPQNEVRNTPVGQILTHEERSLAVVDLGRDASNALRESWSTGQPFHSGGEVDSKWLLALLGTGSTAASSLLAGNVFLATASPATLMTVGTGVGSAVMGPTGIVSQAPFVAASRVLVPVVAPMMLFLTVASVMLCARVDRAQRTLGRISEAVERVRALLDAEDYGRLEAAAERIDQIRSEFEQSGRFASDVPIKLANIDHDVDVLRSKYGHRMSGDVKSEDAARDAVADLNRFFLASRLDVQIDTLQLLLAVQSDSRRVEILRSQLREKLQRYAERFGQVRDGDRVGAYHRELKGRQDKSPLRFLPSPLRFGDDLAAEMRRVGEIRKEFDDGLTLVAQWVEATNAVTDESRRPSLVFYREPEGERTLRVRHTHDIRLERAA